MDWTRQTRSEGRGRATWSNSTSHRFSRRPRGGGTRSPLASAALGGWSACSGFTTRADQLAAVTYGAAIDVEGLMGPGIVVSEKARHWRWPPFDRPNYPGRHERSPIE